MREDLRENMANAPVQGLPYPQAQPKPKGESMDITGEVSSLSRRLRILEERYANLNKKTQVSEQNMLAADRELTKSIRAVGEEVVEVRRTLEDLRDKLKLVVLELRECAKRDELAVLRKYIELWELVKFATVGEVERIVEERVQKI